MHADQVRALNRNMVEEIRVPIATSNDDMQARLDQLYSTEKDREWKKQQAQEQIVGI